MWRQINGVGPSAKPGEKKLEKVSDLDLAIRQGIRLLLFAALTAAAFSLGPRAPPVTYGFGVGIAWTPWMGWGFGFGFGPTWDSGVTVGFGWGGWGWGCAYGGWYGPGYYGPRGYAGSVRGGGYGGWQQYRNDGGWGDFNDADRISDFNQQRFARQWGGFRADGYQRSFGGGWGGGFRFGGKEMKSHLRRPVH
jgi:hypothetical protein